MHFQALLQFIIKLPPSITYVTKQSAPLLTIVILITPQLTW